MAGEQKGWPVSNRAERSGAMAGPRQWRRLRFSRPPLGMGGPREAREARGELDGGFGGSYDGTVVTSGSVGWLGALTTLRRCG